MKSIGIARTVTSRPRRASIGRFANMARHVCPSGCSLSIDFDLGRRFDVVVCLFRACRRDGRRSLDGARVHPFYTPADWKQGRRPCATSSIPASRSTPSIVKPISSTRRTSRSPASVHGITQIWNVAAGAAGHVEQRVAARALMPLDQLAQARALALVVFPVIYRVVERARTW